MAVRQIRIWPDPVLAQKAKPVQAVDDELRALVADLFDTMYEANGVGLAANQVGVLQRVLVIDLDPGGRAEEEPEVQEELDSWGFKGPIALINPQIVESEGTITWEEGCLSVPGITDSVQRKARIVVRTLGLDGQTHDIPATGLFAVAIQHEMDHLNGVVFVEYLSKLKRDVIRRKMTRLKEDTDDGVVAAANL